MFKLEIFVSKLCSVDGFTTGSIVLCKVASLTHEFWNDSMKQGTVEKKKLLEYGFKMNA